MPLSKCEHADHIKIAMTPYIASSPGSPRGIAPPPPWREANDVINEQACEAVYKLIREMALIVCVLTLCLVRLSRGQGKECVLEPQPSAFVTSSAVD